MECPICHRSNLRNISTIRNLSSWAKRFVNPFDLPELLWDTAKGLGNGIRYLFDKDSAVLGIPMQCSDCESYLVVCQECNTVIKTTYPAGGSSRTCTGCGKTMVIPDI